MEQDFHAKVHFSKETLRKLVAASGKPSDWPEILSGAIKQDEQNWHFRLRDVRFEVLYQYFFPQRRCIFVKATDNRTGQAVEITDMGIETNRNERLKGPIPSYEARPSMGEAMRGLRFFDIIDIQKAGDDLRILAMSLKLDV